jgi:hypothetical protein
MAMTEKQQFRQIWDEPAFTKLFQSFRLAVGPTKLTLALLAVVIIALAGWIMDRCSMTVVTNPNVEAEKQVVVYDLDKIGELTELDVYVGDPERTKEFIDDYESQSTRQGVFSTLWHFNAARFNGATVSLLRLKVSDMFANIWLCFKSVSWAIKYHTVYSIIYFLIISVVFCACGGAICRCAALEFARGEKPGLVEALRFGFAKFNNLFTAPMIPVLLMLFLGILVFLLGLVGRVIPWAGELLVAVGLIVALGLGVGIALMLIGTLAGVSLMFPVIAYEGTDELDAISRSIRYVFVHPWWMILYTATAAVCGTISYLFTRFFVFLVLIATYALLDLGFFNNNSEMPDKLARIWVRPDFLNLFTAGAEPANFSESIASFIISLTILLVVGMVVAFVISFYYCSSTIIYSLMRNKVDGVDISEIYVHLDQIRDAGDKPDPDLYGGDQPTKQANSE